MSEKPMGNTFDNLIEYDEIRKEVERRLNRVRMAERNGSFEIARREHHKLVADLLSKMKIKEGDPVTVWYVETMESSSFTDDEQKSVRLVSGSGMSHYEMGDGEFVELTDTDLILHTPGDDVDVTYPIKGILDVT